MSATRASSQRTDPTKELLQRRLPQVPDLRVEPLRHLPNEEQQLSVTAAMRVAAAIVVAMAVAVVAVAVVEVAVGVPVVDTKPKS